MSINAVIDSVSSLTERIKNLIPAYKPVDEIKTVDEPTIPNGEAKSKKQSRMIKKIMGGAEKQKAVVKAIKAKKKAKSVKKAKVAKAARKRNRK